MNRAKSVGNLRQLMFGAIAASILINVDVSTATDAESKQNQSASTGKTSASTKEERKPKKHVLFLSFEKKRKAQEIRNRTIKSIRELLDQTKDVARRYELLRRFGELYMEQAEYALEKEIRTFESKYTAWEKGGKKGPEPKMDNNISSLSSKKAVKIYTEIINTYPHYPGVDVTFYELGKTLFMLNDDSGLKYLERLLKEQPNSAYVPEALFAMGDFWFEKHDMVKAKQYYLQTSKYKNHQIYPYAIYKLGWTHYNFPSKTAEEETEKFKRAVASFKLVVLLADKMGKIDPEKAIFLRQEAINDLIVVWAETEDVQSAWEYFKKIGDQDSFYKMLERLASIYEDQGKNEKAVAVYTRLLEEVPNRTSNAENHIKLIEIYHELGNYALVIKHTEALPKIYMAGGKWFDANKTDSELVTEAGVKIEKEFYKLATTYHKAGQTQKRKELFNVASRLYAGHLQYFPKDPKSYEMRYFLADTLFEQEKFDLATTQYFKVIELNRKDGKYLHDSALNAVISMNTVTAKIKYPELPKPMDIKEPLAIPESKLKLRKALDLYAELFPHKPDTLPMEVTAAKITYDYGHFTDAIARLKKIAMVRKGTKQSEESVKLVLAHYKDRKSWDDLITHTRLFLNAKDVLKGELRTTTIALLKFASFERALALDKQEKNLEAAAAFLAYQEEFPAEPNSPDAIYNAMVIYYKLGLVNQALSSSKRVLQGYPDYKRKPDIILTMSETYEGLSDFDNAAISYITFYKLWPKDKRSPEALYNAGVLYGSTNNIPEAIKNFNEFVKVYPNHELALKCHVELAELYEKQGNITAATTTNQTIIAKYPQAVDEVLLAETKLALAEPDTKKKETMVNAVRQRLVVKGAPRAVKSRELVANHLFGQNEEAFKAFVKNRIETKEDLEAAIGAKQSELVKLARSYEKIIGIGHPDSAVASNYRLGQTHEAFAQHLLTLKIPDKFDEKQKADIQKSLGQLADPLKVEAYKFYNTAFDYANKSQVFTTWAVRTYERMSSLDPKKSPPVDEFQVSPGYVSHSISFDQSIATTLN